MKRILISILLLIAGCSTTAPRRQAPPPLARVNRQLADRDALVTRGDGSVFGATNVAIGCRETAFSTEQGNRWTMPTEEIRAIAVKREGSDLEQVGTVLLPLIPGAILFGVGRHREVEAESIYDSLGGRIMQVLGVATVAIGLVYGLRAARRKAGDDAYHRDVVYRGPITKYAGACPGG